MRTIEHPQYPGRAGRWNVYVTADGVRGCTGSYRWLWRARMDAHGRERFWPGPKVVQIVWEADA